MNLTEEELVFFEIAELLKKPLYVLMEEMTYEEFLGWVHYLKVRPVGWREDYRTYLYLRTQGYKGEPYTLFASLEPIFKKQQLTKEELARKGQISMDNLRKSAFFQKLNTAVDGKALFRDLDKAEVNQ